MSLVAERVKIRLPELAKSKNEALLQELVLTAQDRINSRIGEKILPSSFQSIAVEVVVRVFNRLRYEGLESEDIDNTFRVRLMKDILKDYESDFKIYNDVKERTENPDHGVLRFL